MRLVLLSLALLVAVPAAAYCPPDDPDALTCMINEAEWKKERQRERREDRIDDMIRDRRDNDGGCPNGMRRVQGGGCRY